MTKIATADQQENRPTQLTWIVLAVIGLGGIALAWGLQLAQGMGITGMDQQIAWGIYIAGFFTAMGAGAALVTLTALSEFTPVLPIARRRHGLLLALAGFAVGALLIAMDVGNPINLWRILTAGRFTSLMTWDFLALILTGVLTLVYLIVAWKQSASTGTTRTLGVLSMIAAAVLVIIEGWMLATLSSRPLWTGGLTVVNFLVVALVAGLAAAIISWDDSALKLVTWLRTGLWLTLGLLLIDLVTVLIDSNVRPAPEVNLSLSGNISGFLRAYLIVGVALPLALLYWRKELVWLKVAAGLAILGVLLEKVWFLAAGQAVSWLPLPPTSYAPSWMEIVGILGAIALAVLIYRVLLSAFKVEAR